MSSSKPTVRQRFTLVASTLYVLLGLVIVVRSLVSAVVPIAMLGAVLIALGVVRLRDYRRVRQAIRDS